jgi:hypothetical protein
VSAPATYILSERCSDSRREFATPYTGTLAEAVQHARKLGDHLISIHLDGVELISDVDDLDQILAALVKESKK